MAAATLRDVFLEVALGSVERSERATRSATGSRLRQLRRASITTSDHAVRFGRDVARRSRGASTFVWFTPMLGRRPLPEVAIAVIRKFRRPNHSAPEFIHERQNLLAGLEHFSNPFVD
jgi:hypothetical protein